MRKPTVHEVLPIVEQYYAQGHSAGGCLHIVLDDGNVRDDDVRFCLDRSFEHVGGDGFKPDRDGAWLCHVLLRMSKTQRTRLYFEHGPIAADWGYSVTDACERLLEGCER